MRLVETKVATQALQRDAEARQTQEEIVSLLDAVSRYKETIDVGEDGCGEGQNEAQRLHLFAQECSRE